MMSCAPGGASMQATMKPFTARTGYDGTTLIAPTVRPVSPTISHSVRARRLFALMKSPVR